VADVDGKSEVIIFYEEAIPDAEFKAPPSPDGNGLSESEAQSLFERMAAAVWPDTGDEKRHCPE